MKKIVLAAAAAFLSLSAFAQNKWAVDPMHSSVNFTVKHMGISLLNGHFDKYEGNFTAAKPDLTDAAIAFTVQTASVNTLVEPRDKHLQGDDFFNTEKFPEMKFVSTAFKKVKGNEYTLTGNLTLRDVTKPVTFKVIYGGTAKDHMGNTKAGFHATGTINRLDYNIKYDPSGQGIAKDVAITLDLEFAQAK
ncbi:YceI family protein [Taibaiella chishuiensis]|uniref:Polyisoprenoid-binding protein YceI n=1 Tax=Taibaiella chishuiensis TaxID=1434707 RepID=A0A2P8CWA7_9BACT|nr:YceI family protein [Taibaiella chishuiensis]PSK89245.1 polyisoprenoid-binding protein YceI [Taibaiella chishuiensis]